jgi:hypothetical protein
MAYIAFDLDNTLGYFSILSPLAFFWSPESLENHDQEYMNPPLDLSKRLESKLKRARSQFMQSLIKEHHLLQKIIRPNIDSFLDPIVKKRVTKQVKAVVVYSNTTNYYTMEFAKQILERQFKCTGLFSSLVNIYHPIRKGDIVSPPPLREYKEPLKTFTTLQGIFQEATRSSTVVHPDQVAFVDDRDPVHNLYKEKVNGLTYIKVTPFFSTFTKKEKKELFQLAFDALQKVGLLNDIEYLQSGMCNRIVSFEQYPVKVLNGFPDLFSYVWSLIEAVPNRKVPWYSDSFSNGRQMTKFLEKF